MTPAQQITAARSKMIASAKQSAADRDAYYELVYSFGASVCEEPTDNEVAAEVTRQAVSMRLLRKRRNDCEKYWRTSIMQDRRDDDLIADALENAPEIVEEKRLEAISKYAAFADAYPERCELV